MTSVYKNNRGGAAKSSSHLALNVGGWLLGGLGVGALVMYFLDPESGVDRRKKAARLANQATQRLGQVKETLMNVAQADSVADAIDQVSEQLPEPDKSSSLPLLSIATTAIGCGVLGAAVMYMLDPDSGRRRRAYMRDHATSSVRNTAEMITHKGTHLRNKAQGLYHDAAKVVHNSRFPGTGAEGHNGSDS